MMLHVNWRPSVDLRLMRPDPWRDHMGGAVVVIVLAGLVLFGLWASR